MSNSQPTNKKQVSETSILIKLGRISRNCRETKGLSVSQLADRADVSASDLTSFEAGTLDIEILSLYALAKALDTTAASILEEAERDCVILPFKK